MTKVENQDPIVAECIAEISDFYNLPVIDVNIQLMRTRKEFDKLENRKTEDWLVGVTKNNVIYILEKDKFEEYSVHPKSDFETVLKHEIAHIYYKQLKPNGYPNWLDEGTACYAANQKKNSPKKINMDILKNYYKTADKDIYLVGYYMVNKIIEEFGKNKLFELIKIEQPDTLYDELEDMFDWLK